VRTRSVAICGYSNGARPVGVKPTSWCPTAWYIQCRKQGCHKKKGLTCRCAVRAAPRARTFTHRSGGQHVAPVLAHLRACFWAERRRVAGASGAPTVLRPRVPECPCRVRRHQCRAHRPQRRAASVPGRSQRPHEVARTASGAEAACARARAACAFRGFCEGAFLSAPILFSVPTVGPNAKKSSFVETRGTWNAGPTTWSSL
jgi:hypothetical protein